MSARAGVGRPSGRAEPRRTEEREVVLAAVAEAYRVQTLDPRTYAGEFDRNYRFTDPVRGTWVAKVSDAWVPQVSLDWQETVLEAAAGAGLPFATPVVLRTGAGRARIRVPAGTSGDGAAEAGTEGGTALTVRVVSWVDGTPLAEASQPRIEVFRDMGAASARLTEAFGRLEVPAGLPAHEWLLHRGPEVIRTALAPLRRALSEEAGRPRGDAMGERVLAFVTEFEARYAARLPEVPWSVVHQDLHDGNVLVDRDGRLAGVIDMNDAHLAPRVSDVAIAAAYAMRRTEEPLARLEAVIAGYEGVLELAEAERDLVLPLAIMRLCANWAVWQARSAELPEAPAPDDYSYLRSKDTWATLEGLLPAVS